MNTTVLLSFDTGAEKKRRKKYILINDTSWMNPREIVFTSPDIFLPAFALDSIIISEKEPKLSLSTIHGIPKASRERLGFFARIFTSNLNAVRERRQVLFKSGVSQYLCVLKQYLSLLYDLLNPCRIRDLNSTRIEMYLLTIAARTYKRINVISEARRIDHVGR